MIVIYHAKCDDGFAAAWVLRQKFGDEIEEFIPAQYGEEPPIEKCRDKRVVIADFSYKREPMRELMRASGPMTVLDHHKTAKDELDGLDTADGSTEIIFDMERSGATMTWDWCFPGTSRPALIERIEDNDLWRTPRRYEDSILVQAALRSHPQDFDVWDELVALPIEFLEHEGKAIRRYIDGRIAALKEGAIIRDIGGVEMPVCNAPGFFASDLAGQLAEEHESGMAACYFDLPKMRVYSLRGRKGRDVSEIAKKLGGGGHPGAAGFQVPRP